MIFNKVKFYVHTLFICISFSAILYYFYYEMTRIGGNLMMPIMLNFIFASLIKYAQKNYYYSILVRSPEKNEYKESADYALSMIKLITIVLFVSGAVSMCAIFVLFSRIQ